MSEVSSGPSLGWPYGDVSESQVRGRLSEFLQQYDPPERRELALRSAVTVLVNLIPLYGVLYWNWDAFAILVYFYGEGLIAVALDVVRYLRILSADRSHAAIGFALLFQAAFLIVAGGMMILFLGPHGEDLLQTLRLIKEALLGIIPTMHWPLLVACAFQVAQLTRDWPGLAQPVGHPFPSILYMLLLFFTPFVALGFFWMGSLAGVASLLALRLLTQLLSVWIIPVAYHVETRFQNSEER